MDDDSADLSSTDGKCLDIPHGACRETVMMDSLDIIVIVSMSQVRRNALRIEKW